jgi:hypothetical protein
MQKSIVYIDFTDSCIIDRAAISLSKRDTRCGLHFSDVPANVSVPTGIEPGRCLDSRCTRSASEQGLTGHRDVTRCGSHGAGITKEHSRNVHLPVIQL